MQFLRYPQARDWLAEQGVVLAEATLRRKVSLRQIPFTKCGKAVLFSPDRLAAWLTEQAVEPRASA